ncbi:ATP-binding protein [Tardiphaga sp. 538_B7_N1_4]|jgi:signal transduction histidine kinase|uniref:ATP-binding protein n=1 Tax=Tardiphaga sp. 538_B7_N1_4 TaxID=3240778 RepID=UPI003F2639AC
MATFRVRARTVDMLGRQQIAGIPTAISELFKNAHDAYARNVEVDYFRKENLFVLRDDGLGMTKDDFEQRWLSLGTESKLGTSTLSMPPRDPDQPKRPTLGEKGIGRLAVAIIGPQALILSRAKRDKAASDVLVAAYINWSMFELPGVDLADITIPLIEVKGGRLPGKKDVQGMLSEATRCLEKIGERADARRIREIQRQISLFSIDPTEWEWGDGTPSLTGGGCGTHFFIQPADPIIREDIDSRQSDSKATRFERNLIGFTNTMVPDRAPPIVARFRDHKSEAPPAELIGDAAFFTPGEFQEVDHHFQGTFDEFGQFRGKVGVYQTTPEDYVLTWSESDGKKTQCGPFSLSFAYMQGTPRDSLVPPDEHARLRRKLDRIGGLYVYRDGIRVQPYGDSDFDWLDIERNRTLGAGYYFYSYRRIFGFIELNAGRNDALSEKAGREGFRDNTAYRQLRSILMNFFVQTAGDFFRETGKFADSHFERKAELNRNEDIRRKQATNVRKKRGAFQESISKVFSLLDEGSPERQVKQVFEDTKSETASVIRQNIPTPQKAMALMRIEKGARNKIAEIRKSVSITKPRGVSLSRALSNEWSSYSAHLDRLVADTFEPAENEIERFVSKLAGDAAIPLNDAARLTAAVSEFSDEALRSVRTLRTDIGALSTQIANKVRETTRDSFHAVNHTVDEVIAELDKLQRSSTRTKDLSAVREELSGKITAVQHAENSKLERLRDQLNEVNRVWTDDGYDTTELTVAIEEELEELRDRRDADIELAQIGLALNTVSHEFEKNVGSIRQGIDRLGSWAAENPELNDLHQELRLSFDHLDEYLALFTQLDRRANSSPIEISGKQIFEFCERLFAPRLLRHRITLKGTSAFNRSTLKSYPSAIYPVFVNLIDNAIYWLQRNRNDRTITLDAAGADLLIRDNGPGISIRDRENVFALNFSRKPGGRGMGLHISRQTLARVGFALELDPKVEDEGATFRISAAKEAASKAGRRRK